jgi:hypothetical protein
MPNSGLALVEVAEDVHSKVETTAMQHVDDVYASVDQPETIRGYGILVSE